MTRDGATSWVTYGVSHLGRHISVLAEPTRWSCTGHCKEQPQSTEIAPAPISHTRRLVLRACPGRSAARSGALQTRDRSSLWRSRISGAPLHSVTRCTASGTRAGGSDPCIFLFFCRFGLFHPRSHDLRHTHTHTPP